MKESLISAFVVLASNILTFFIGKIQGRKKTESEIDLIQLENLKKIVDLYKDTFEGLQKEVHKLKNSCTALALDVHLSNEDRAKLSKEINELRRENIDLKKQILELNHLITQLNNM